VSSPTDGMTAEPASPAEPAPGRRRQPRSRRSRILRWSAFLVAGLMIAVTLTGYAYYRHLDANLSVITIGPIKNQPPPSAKGVENFLILGSQTRNGQTGGQAEFGTDPNTNLSDNIILFHVNASHTEATVVSIPRDTMVYEPACGTTPAIQQAIIDGAMNLGGPTCAVATVEALTGIRIDHYIRFTFNSFRDTIDAVGGVEVCLRQPVDDPYSHLDLDAGEHYITGNEALEFVRTRHGVSDGGDLGRIELQQEFISSLMQKVEHENIFSDPLTLASLADAVTKDVTVDNSLGSVSALLEQAYGLRNIKTSDIEFITMPTIEDPQNLNRLLPEDPEDDIIWQMLKTGQTWHGSLPVPEPSAIEVSIENGTGQPDLAATAAAQLRKLGFDVTSVGDAPADQAATTVSYTGTAEAGGAYALMNALTVTPAAISGGGTPAATGGGTPTMVLTLGTNFGGVKAAKSAITNNPQTTAGALQQQGTGYQVVQSRSAAQNICSGLPDSNPDS